MELLVEEDVASSSCWLWVRMVIWNVANKGIKNKDVVKVLKKVF